jgi:hypothetical protein
MGVALRLSVYLLVPGLFAVPTWSQVSSSTSAAGSPRKAAAQDSSLDPGSITNGVYRNKTLGFTYKIPPGWVLRTDEMNAEGRAALDRADEGVRPSTNPASTNPADEGVRGSTSDASHGQVLLAAFSRPPEAKGEDVNSSILIAAESVAAYPGLKEAVQYFEPLTAVAKARGFSADEEPYEFAVGTKTLVRGDFHKNVGTRVMRQSTLAMLAHGYAVSFTVIGGTDDEVEELIDGLDFQAAPRASPPRK